MLLAKANNWEGEVIDKEEKLYKAKDKLNENSRCVVELKEVHRMVEVESSQNKRKDEVRA